MPASGRRPSGRRRSPTTSSPVAGVEHEDVAAGRLGVRGGRAGPLVAATDDHDVDLAARRPRSSGASGGARRRPGRRPTGSGGMPVGRVALDGQPGPGRRLARPDVGDAVDRREAVAAVAGQAQRARRGPGTSPARRIAIATESPASNGDRPPVDDDPRRVADRCAAADASVTGASAGPAGRTAARAGAGPAAAGR